MVRRGMVFNTPPATASRTKINACQCYESICGARLFRRCDTLNFIHYPRTVSKFMKIAQYFTTIQDLLTTFNSCYESASDSKRTPVWETRIPRNSITIDYKQDASVRSAGISVTGPLTMHGASTTPHCALHDPILLPLRCLNPSLLLLRRLGKLYVSDLGS